MYVCIYIYIYICVNSICVRSITRINLIILAYRTAEPILLLAQNLYCPYYPRPRLSDYMLNLYYTSRAGSLLGAPGQRRHPSFSRPVIMISCCMHVHMCVCMCTCVCVCVYLSLSIYMYIERDICVYIYI